MIAIALRFPGGRYHATPWGHHVNEGLVEWPPSPWRLIRAFIATGYSKLGWPQEPPETAKRLLERLSDVLPYYRLPKASLAHTRHYMPAPVKTTLVFDTWARVGIGQLTITWNVELPDDERDLLSELLEKLSYLGRAEAWVEGHFLAAGELMPAGNDSMPCDGVPHPGPGWEQIPLLAPLPASEHTRWRQESLKPLLNASPLPTSKKQAKNRPVQRTKIEEAYPADLLGCLQVDTAWLQSKGWSQPPGSRRVFYWRKTDALVVGHPQAVRKVKGKPVEAMFLALATPSGNKHSLPPVMRTLPQAELLHRALVSAANPASGNLCPAITGTDAVGVPLKGHQHAHVLPLDLDGDGHLEHILVWAPMGLGTHIQNAVRSIRRTFTKGGVGDLRVALAGVGSLDDIRKLASPLGDQLRSVLGANGGSTIWTSLTPFVPPRHLKRKGKNTLDGQVVAELASRGLSAPASVELISCQDERAKRFRHWVRRRRDGPHPPIDCAVAIRLRFTKPQAGPLCLGYGSHFGLGLFAASDS